ncbi:MAG: PorP/SprF family type IX secretion system membrane protein [Paludibacter sp.]|nr:PorP/SprF family type IX secretion system membrane protein [Paludibacter sp.]
MKKIIFIVGLNLISFLIVAQSNIRLNNYWGNAHYINPATIYDKYVAVFSMAARKQWIGINGAPMTYFASGSTYIDNLNTQLGLIAVQDKIGYTSITNLDFTYAYAIKMQQEWQLHLGLGVNYQSLSYDISQVSLASDYDPQAYQNLATSNNYNADFGVEVTNKYWKIGASSQNLFSIFSTDHKYQTNTNFLYSRYRQYTNDPINIGFGVCGIQYSNMYQAEFNLTGYFKVNQKSGLEEKPDLFDLGLFFRTGSEIGVILGFDLSESIHLSYSYDYNVGSLNRGSIGTNELIITYNLIKEPVCHNCWY